MPIVLFAVMMLVTLVGLAYPLLAASSGQAVVSAEARTCVECGRILEQDSQFCPGCGVPAGLSCLACGRSLDPDDAFCPGCGKKVGEA